MRHELIEDKKAKTRAFFFKKENGVIFDKYIKKFMI